MRAALLRAANQPLEMIDDLVVAEPGAGQVRVRIGHCGLCHSDLSIVDGAFPAQMPVVLGHEASGVVEEVGPGVTRVAPGDPVVLSPCPPCGLCYWCLRRQPTLCVESAGLFTGGWPDGSTPLRLPDSAGGGVVYRGLGVGAFGEYAVVAETAAIPVGVDVPLDVACVIGCAVQTGVGAVLNTAGVEEGATVLVLGLGGIGLSVVQGARAAAAGRIIASDPVAERRNAAKALGATDLIDPASDDVTAVVMDLTRVGADYAFEAAGRAVLIETGLASVRRGGTVVCVGAPPLDDSLTISPAVLFAASEKKLLGCLLGTSNSLREVPRLVALWQRGHLDLEALITTRRPIEQINLALDDLRASRGVRTVLSF